jgi:hypothetical protein
VSLGRGRGKRPRRSARHPALEIGEVVANEALKPSEDVADLGARLHHLLGRLLEIPAPAGLIADRAIHPRNDKEIPGLPVERLGRLANFTSTEALTRV